MIASRPLPGIRFEGRTPPLRDPLPRMDIPAFVGFAASGPIDVPVPIEDPAEFAMIFGGDVLLPKRRGAAEDVTAHLAGAVRAFFGNGGRRGWVIRVAGGRARANRFPLPGVSRVTLAGAIEPARLVARSEGSWSDACRVRTNLVSTPLALVGSSPPAIAPPLFVAVVSRADVAVGDLVRVTWTSTDAVLHLFVQSIDNAPGSPPAGFAGMLRLAGRGLWLHDVVITIGGETRTVSHVAPPPAPAALSGPAMAERLTFDLTVFQEGVGPVRLTRLGFAPDHPRYLGALPSDGALFDEAVDLAEGGRLSFRPRTRVEFPSNFLTVARAPERGWIDLWRDASRPRFPLAAALDGSAYVPTGMGVLPTDPAVGPDADGAATLERDGLDVFDASLFLDPDLADAVLRDVVDRADAIRYRAIPPRRLRGLHAVVGVEEVTMVAAPDLVHSGWEPAGVSGLASPLASSPLDHPEWWRWIDCRAPRPEPAPPPFAGFMDCAATIPIDPPRLEFANVHIGSYEVRWETLIGAMDEVQESLRPDFADAVTIAQGADGALVLYDRPPADYYYRARRTLCGRTSDWSAGIVVRVPSLAGWVAVDPGFYDAATLLTVQRALIRTCAALADRVAVLALPKHYDAGLALAHITALTSAPTEPAALSYVALWHPWLTRRDAASGALRAAPPEGAMAAVMAARALARGAWVAPANEALRGVVALDPAIPAAAHQALQDAGLNLIRQEPSGFLCLNADTLSTDDDVRPLNVRRLLILIRRVALRAGNRFTFEPNGERLRRAVKRGFETVLEQMFARGAFAGRRSSDGFRVVTEESLNTPQSIDAGRLLAEIRVAPSRPLSFLTVRLVQRGDATVATEVR
jgi:Phage tail sheath C-terminal domain